MVAVLPDILRRKSNAGTIEQSWRQQPGSPGYLKDYDAAGVRQALAEATEVRTPEWRATPNPAS